MLKTFKAFYKHLLESKLRFAAYIVLLFIPFIYGFIYMNAYWAPFKNSNKLRIAIVNLKKDNLQGDSVKRKIMQDGKTYKIGNKAFPINFVDKSEDIYNLNSKDKEAVAEQWVKDDKFSAVLIIPELYKDTSINAPDPSDQKFEKPSGKFDEINWKLEWDVWAKKHIIKFYNSYKNSFLAGEMTNFIAGLKELHLTSAYPGLEKILQQVAASGIKIPDAKAIAKRFVKVHTTGQNINTYGFGLSPYFISIAIWAGCLTMTFIIKNERHIKGIKTMKHYLGNTLVWLLTGWAQATILLTGITIQGVNLGWAHQWELWIFVYFVSTIFSLLVQSIVFMIRYGDLGDFIVVILLVMQLVSSSGTFPVEIQNIIFRILHPIAPFTYSIQGIREIFDAPDVLEVFKNMGILLLFPLVTVPLSMTINKVFDKKTFAKNNEYRSFEIHMGDL